MKLHTGKTFVLMLLVSSCIGPSDDGDVLASIGYASDAGFALSGVKYKEDAMGFYSSANLKVGGGNGGTNYTDTIGPGGFPGDPFLGDFQEFWGISAGPSYKLAPYLGAYVGIAYQMTTTWNEYYDPSHILDPSGNYYIQDDRDSDFGVEAGFDLLLARKFNLGLRANTISESAVVMVGWKL